MYASQDVGSLLARARWESRAVSVTRAIPRAIAPDGPVEHVRAVASSFPRRQLALIKFPDH